MKNNFLIFYLALSLLFFFSADVAFAAITSVITNAPAIGLTSATLSGTSALTDNVNEAYDVRGFNFGTASAAAGNYTSSSTITGAFTGGGTFTHATTSLTKGTVYYFRAYASSSTAPAATRTVYGSEVSFITGVDEPTSLAKTAASGNSIDLSWTKGTGADNTYLRYRTDQYPTSITNGTQVCAISGTSCSLGGLSCGSSYYFSAWSSTTAATLTTTSNSNVQLLADAGGCFMASSGGGGASRTAPTTYSDSLVINNGAVAAQTKEVTLKLKANNANLMTVCDRSDFLNCGLETYATAKSWTLSEGDGVKTIYVKFVSLDGLNSDVVSDTIILETPTPISTPAPVPAPVPVPVPVPVPEPATPKIVIPEPAAETPALIEKSISEMTKEEITAKIAEIMIQVKALQEQLTGVKEVKKNTCTINSFDRGLKLGMFGNDVKCLQIILNSDSDTKITESGYGSLGEETNYFGSLTKAAVIKFQEKYASEILTPLGLTKGTGLIGSATRVKLNELLGKQYQEIRPPEEVESLKIIAVFLFLPPFSAERIF